MGGEEMVKKKITSYSARDMVNPHVFNSVKDNMENGIDVFFRSKLELVNIDGTYPKFLLENLDTYAHLIK